MMSSGIPAVRRPARAGYRRLWAHGVWLGIVCAAAGAAANERAEEVTSFRTGILPLLTKAGCNAGACHGAATGQGGFKLSLLGYDPEEDHERITRELGGRRIDRRTPAASLILRKPSRELAHEGGRRLPRDSSSHRKILAWISAGAPYGRPDLWVKEISVSPPDVFFPDTNQAVSFRVTAVLSDDSREEVTPLALYSSNDEAIAEVDAQGRAMVRGRGVTSVVVRYGGQAVAARIAVPFNASPPGPSHAPAIKHNFVDEYIAGELKRLHLPASPPSSDAEFLRRVYLDLTGRLPSLEEARAFPAHPEPAQARRELIERLLASEAFVDLWTLRLADLLLVGGKHNSEPAARAYHGWLREQIARNTPFDQLAYRLLTAAGNVVQEPPANFFYLANDPRDLAEHASRMFLGTQIACARCHAHPMDRWTQEDYHRFAAYFARVTRNGDVLAVAARGEVDHPKTGEPLLPRPLDRAAITAPDARDRRIELAEWMTSPQNPRFARTIVNRVWKHLLGRGLVEPVDDLRPTNPPTHPALLEALASDFIQHKFDLRHLLRTLANSATYQRSSRTLDGNRADDRFYSRAYVKELSAQVFLDAAAQVTEIAEVFEGYPPGTRAVQLVDARPASYALEVLGRCSRESSCEGGSRAGGGLALALHLLNGTTVNDKLSHGVVAHLAEGPLTDDQIVEELYLRALVRRPMPAEAAEWKSWLARSTNRRETIQDLVWTLLNAREFAFNH